MKLFIASDHRGFNLKSDVLRAYHIEGLQNVSGLVVDDLGPTSSDSVDYPVYAHKVALEVARHGGYGILICGSGIGVAMAANKVAGVRAATCRSVTDAVGTRRHNDANVICIGADETDAQLAIAMIEVFRDTEFEGGRHQTRVDLIEKI